MKKTLLALVGLSMALSISGVEIFGNLLAVISIAALFISKGKQFSRQPFDLPILLFFIWNLFCALWGKSLGFGGAVSKQGALLLYVMIAHSLEEEEWRQLVYWFCVGAAVAGGWGLTQQLLDQKTIPLFNLRNGRAVGTRSHPLTYAETFIPAIFILFPSVFLKGEFKRKELLATVLMAGGLLCSQSRGVWLGVTAGALLVLISHRQKINWIAVLSFGLLALMLLGLSPRLRLRAQSAVDPNAGAVSDRQSSSTRLEFWRQSLQLIKEKPITGVGMTGAHLRTIDPITNQERFWTETHNIYLQVAVNSGLVGLGLFLWIVLIALKLIFQMPRQTSSLAAAILIAFLVCGLTESWISDKEITFIFWSFIGVLTKKNEIQI